MTTEHSLTSPLLLPQPRSLSLTGGRFALPADALIVLDSDAPQALLFTARQLQQALQEWAGVAWQIVAGKGAPAAQMGVILAVVPSSVQHNDGYTLTITPQRIDVVASQPSGVFYAVQTLRQLLQQASLQGDGDGAASLPTLRCTDWPDFSSRGVMLDISRDKVPTMETLYALVDMLAGLKVNQLQLYTEHTFAYRSHPEVWEHASPLTGEEILALDAYCRERFVELVPNQNTFGHMHRWLVLERYRDLAEVQEGAKTPWGYYWKGPYSLSPLRPGSLELVRDLLDELLPHFSSRQVNVGCDETFDLGQGLGKALVEQHGVGRFYLDFVMKIYREVKARGRTMQYWGDIIMEHPEIVPDLPRDAIALEWGYEWCHPFERHCITLADAGIPFYVCPGTSSWRSLAGRTDNALANLGDAAVYGLQYGAIGYLNTDWGDEGHWQPLPVSYLGLAMGAAFSWAYEANKGVDVQSALDRFVFIDTAGQMGALAYELGNVYKETGIPTMNSSALFDAMLYDPSRVRSYVEPHKAGLGERMATAEQRIDQAMTRLPLVSMQRADAGLIRREYTWVADMLRHGCRRLLWITGETASDPAMRCLLAEDAGRLIDEHRAIWHARNRPGGFRESVARLERMREAYA